MAPMPPVPPESAGVAAAPAVAPLHARRPRTAAWLALALYVAGGAVGFWYLFRPELATRFEWMETDPVDPLLNGYLLEHELRVVEGRDHRGTFWSPPFFFPARNVLTYSENMMGMLPIYGLLRLCWEPVVSYQLLFMLLCMLDYAAMVLVLRRFGVGPPLAMLGGFCFAFGARLGGQLGHIQLFGIFYAPLALWALWRLVAEPSRRRLAWLLVLLYLQVVTGIYIGWFFLLALALLVPAILIWDDEGRRRLARFCRAAPGFVVAAMGGWAAALWLTLRPYLAASAELGPRPWHHVLTFLPSLRSWFSVPPGNPYYRLLSEAAVQNPWEHRLFPGLVPIILGALSLWYVVRLPRQERRRQALLVACWIVTLALFAATLVVPRLELDGWRLVKTYPGLSLWWFVFRWVPGATAIRAVGRLSIVIYLLALLAACWGADALLRRSRLRPAARAILVGVLLVAGVAEQHAKSPPAFEKARISRRVAHVLAAIPPGCQLLYVAPQRRGKGYMTTQMVAMWAGLDAGLPVVNGYSGNLPPRYPLQAEPLSSSVLAAWTGGGRPCIVTEPAELVDP